MSLAEKINAIFEKMIAEDSDLCERNAVTSLQIVQKEVLASIEAHEKEQATFENLRSFVTKEGVEVEIVTHEQAAADFAKLGLEYPFKP